MPGQPGNASIAGHRTTWGAPFNRIDELDPGDEITVRTVQGTFVYRVVEQDSGKGHFIVTPDRVDVLDQDFTEHPNRLTLTACHPKFSAAPAHHRGRRTRGRAGAVHRSHPVRSDLGDAVLASEDVGGGTGDDRRRRRARRREATTRAPTDGTDDAPRPTRPATIADDEAARRPATTDGGGAGGRPGRSHRRSSPLPGPPTTSARASTATARPSCPRSPGGSLRWPSGPPRRSRRRGGVASRPMRSAWCPSSSCCSSASCTSIRRSRATDATPPVPAHGPSGAARRRGCRCSWPQ